MAVGKERGEEGREGGREGGLDEWERERGDLKKEERRKWEEIVNKLRATTP